MKLTQNEKDYLAGGIVGAYAGWCVVAIMLWLAGVYPFLMVPVLQVLVVLPAAVALAKLTGEK